MEQVEVTREKKDLLYHVINNNEASTLNDIVNRIRNHVNKKYEDKSSIRLKKMLQQVCNSDDRVAKHAFLFFTLVQEPECRKLFMSDTPRVPPEKFKRFVEEELPVLVNKLTTGAFTSLRAFAEDARWTYCTL